MDPHRDHPDEYFRRLQSYSRTNSDLPKGPRTRPHSERRTSSHSSAKPRPHVDSQTNSYRDAADASEVTPPKRSKRRPRAESNPSFDSEAPTRARHTSYAESTEGSEIARPRRSKRRPRPDSLASLHPDAPAPPKDEARSAYPDLSEVTAPKKSRGRPLLASLASCEEDDGSATRRHHESYASTRPSSYLSSRPQSYADTDALAHDINEKSDSNHRSPKRINAELLREYDELQEGPRQSWWTRGRKICVGSIVAVIALIIIIVGAVVGSRKGGFKYTPSYAQVNNTIAFQKGGATHQSINMIDDGIGPGQDVYQYYTGKAAMFPDASKWVSFQNMWNSNLPNIQKSCGWLGYPPDNSAQDTAYLFNAIQDRANASLVDHRFILAIVLQESHGCVRVGGTTSSGGVTNPGLMQSHDGDSYVKSNAWLSILLMIQDGVQGTKSGDGLVQLLDTYGDPYSAARGYNSGYIPKSGDLSEAAGATACYVSDVANRLTGWVNAESTCPGHDA